MKKAQVAEQLSPSVKASIVKAFTKAEQTIAGINYFVKSMKKFDDQ